MEKLVLALVHASKRLRRYFQAHPITVITDQPIKNILSSPEVASRMQKWSIQLGEFGIHYRRRVSIKGQVLADFIIERPEEEGQDDSTKEEEPLPARWTLFPDESSCVDGCGAGVILTDPEGVEFTYALRFQFETTNNEVKYEALIAGFNFRAFSIKQVPRSKNKKADALSKMASTSFAHLSKQVLVEELKEKSVNEKEVLTVKWGIDIARPFPEGPGKVKFLIVAMDYFTKWIEAKPVATIMGNQSKQKFGEGIKARLGKDNKNWLEEISHVLWAHRTMVKSSNGDTPFFNNLRKRKQSPRKLIMPTFRTAEVNVVENDEALEINLELLEEKREQAAIREAKSKRQMEKYYNTKVRNASFKLGDLVYRSNEASRVEDTGKLGPKWEGPYEVTEALGKGSYKLKDRDGRNPENLERLQSQEVLYTQNVSSLTIRTP
ncbi:reverse transcriptase domain-containing protein [Tanacetum coccineum]